MGLCLGYKHSSLQSLITNYLLTRPLAILTIDRAIARSLKEGGGLIFYRKDRTVEVNA